MSRGGRGKGRGASRKNGSKEDNSDLEEEKEDSKVPEFEKVIQVNANMYIYFILKE